MAGLSALEQTKIPYPSPSDTGEMATDVDVALGAPITPTNVEVISAWGEAQSPTFPGFNLLGTTLALPGSTAVAGNSAGVQEYPTLTEGLEATVDMMLGEGPQKTALETKFVSDLRSGTASESTLEADIAAGGWNGTPPDTYDANAIAELLGGSQFNAAGSPASGTTDATLTSAPGGALDPLNWPGEVLGSAGSSIAGEVGTYILKGVLTLLGAGMVFYGAVLTTKRGNKSQAPATIIGMLPSLAPEAAEAAAL